MKFSHNIFYKNVLTLMSGSVIVQAINIGTLPILTRIYMPGEFGVFVLYSSLLVVIGLFVSLRYEESIIASETDEEAWQCLCLSLTLMAFICVVFGLISAILYGLRDIYTVPYFELFLLGAVHLAAVGLFTSLQYWMNRCRHYTNMAIGGVLAVTVKVALSIGLGVAGYGAVGLILGALAGIICNAVFLMIMIWKNQFLYAWPTLGILQKLARKNIDFPLYLVPSGLLARVSNQLHIFVFANIFSPAVVGAIGLYNNAVSLPTTLVGTSVGNVFKQQAAKELNEKGECLALFRFTIMRLFFIGIIPFILLLTVSPFMFTFVFGPQWVQAGQFAQILSPIFLFGFIVSPVSSILYLRGNQKYDLISQLTLFFLVGIAMICAYYSKNELYGLAAFSAANCLRYSLEFYLAYKIARGPKKMLHDGIKNAEV